MKTESAVPSPLKKFVTQFRPFQKEPYLLQKTGRLCLKYSPFLKSSKKKFYLLIIEIQAIATFLVVLLVILLVVLLVVLLSVFLWIFLLLVVFILFLSRLRILPSRQSIYKIESIIDKRYMISKRRSDTLLLRDLLEFAKIFASVNIVEVVTKNRKIKWPFLFYRKHSFCELGKWKFSLNHITDPEKSHYFLQRIWNRLRFSILE